MDNSPRFEGIPELIYGTAFKFDNTASLVEIAIKSGFRALDTAANRPQYRESQVGEGIAAAIASGVVKRHELYVRLVPLLPSHHLLQHPQTPTNHTPRLPPIDPNKIQPPQTQPRPRQLLLRHHRPHPRASSPVRLLLSNQSRRVLHRLPRPALPLL